MLVSYRQVTLASSHTNLHYTISVRDLVGPAGRNNVWN